MENMIIYQMALRTFTPEGTLSAANRLLPFVASIVWIENNMPDQIFSYIKRTANSAVAAIVNTQNKPVDVNVSVNLGKVYMKSEVVINDKITMGAYGYIIAETE